MQMSLQIINSQEIIEVNLMCQLLMPLRTYGRIQKLNYAYKKELVNFI